MTALEQHPPLIDLDTGDEYEWVTEPAGGGEPGYAHPGVGPWCRPDRRGARDTTHRPGPGVRGDTHPAR